MSNDHVRYNVEHDTHVLYYVGIWSVPNNSVFSRNSL